MGGIVIILLLLLSTLGFALSFVGFGGNTGIIEEPQGFSNNGQYWVYTAGSQKYYFSHHPEELNYTFTINKNLLDFGNRQLYIDSEIPGALQEIATNIGPYTAKFSEACYGTCEKDLPERDCSELFIVTRESEVESITEEDQCIFINGSIKTVDSFLYKLLGLK